MPVYVCLLAVLESPVCVCLRVGCAVKGLRVPALCLCPLGQSGEVRVHWVCCYHCCASRERMNVSAVPTAPWVFFQLSRLCLDYLGIKEQ